MNGARGRGRVGGIGHRALARFEAGNKFFPRKQTAVVVNLQRADTWRDIDDAAQALLAQRALELMHTKAKGEVEKIWADLDEQVSIAGRAIDDIFTLMQDRRFHSATLCNRYKSHGIAGPQLA